MASKDQFVRVDFYRFKAFRSFTLHLRHFNILVGPNNAGKSTILAAFRILSAAIRRARSRSAELIRGPDGRTLGHNVNLTSISVAGENIFHNYDDSEPATVKFSLSSGNTLTLYFPERDTCYLIADAGGKAVAKPREFLKQFDCTVGFVPILGPVDHVESLLERDAARLALFNYAAARNFRNIWYHYPEKFDEFRETLKSTWPGMDVERPRVEVSNGRPKLFMFCPEERIPREIFWAGFGFQVWCQMLTHVIQQNDVSIFLIDEPDIYLHPDLQRQLIGLLRSLGPDILLATHSTEIVAEAEADELVLVTKTKARARRIKDPSQLEEVFRAIGSNLNPILTQLAKTRRVLFVEGKDFQILSKFAYKLGHKTVATRSAFAVVPVEGFSPERMRSLKKGMETTLGARVLAAAVLDGDFRCAEERARIKQECETFCDFVAVLGRKEVENYLLVPEALDRAISRRTAERVSRLGGKAPAAVSIQGVLDDFVQGHKSYLVSQVLDNRRRYDRSVSPSRDDASAYQRVLDEIEKCWPDRDYRLSIVGGKQVLSDLNSHLQQKHRVSVTPTAIVESMTPAEVPDEMRALIEQLQRFSQKSAR
jgi:energy-coupling factor transporter ATP-binding protein EcfA2